ncbi:MAG: hypothetical protein Q9170_000882 [Blastenia crenularia]
MHFSSLYIGFIFLLNAIDLSDQVDVLLGGTFAQWRLTNIFGTIESWHAACQQLRPGECCSVPPDSFIDPGMLIVEDLQPLDIVFLWKRRRVSWFQTTRGCSGIPFRRHVGGPRWQYSWATENAQSGQGDMAVTGVSYIRLPPKVPPDPGEVDWLAVEGMKGLVWGGGKWFANQVGYPPSTTKILRRGEHQAAAAARGAPPQISNNKALYKGGTVYATAPPWQRFVDWMMVTGTNFTRDEQGDLRYVDDAGRVLSFNTIAT